MRRVNMEEDDDGAKSPRSAFKRARDKSLKELEETFVSQQLSEKISMRKDNKSKSPDVPDYRHSSVERQPYYSNLGQESLPEIKNGISQQDLYVVTTTSKSNTRSPLKNAADHLENNYYHQEQQPSALRYSPQKYNYSNHVQFKQGVLVQAHARAAPGSAKKNLH